VVLLRSLLSDAAREAWGQFLKRRDAPNAMRPRWSRAAVIEVSSFGNLKCPAPI
jgi:hypothetical protein